MRNENDVKRLVSAIIKTTPNVWFFMPPANGYGRSGIPDFIGAVNGHLFAVETKFGSNQLSAHQQIEINNLVATGNKVWIVRETSLYEFEIEFRGWAAICS